MCSSQLFPFLDQKMQKEQLEEGKFILELTVSEVTVHRRLNPVFWDGRKAEHHGGKRKATQDMILRKPQESCSSGTKDKIETLKACPQ